MFYSLVFRLIAHRKRKTFRQKPWASLEIKLSIFCVDSRANRSFRLLSVFVVNNFNEFILFNHSSHIAALLCFQHTWMSTVSLLLYTIHIRIICRFIVHGQNLSLPLSLRLFSPLLLFFENLRTRQRNAFVIISPLKQWNCKCNEYINDHHFHHNPKHVWFHIQQKQLWHLYWINTNV